MAYLEEGIWDHFVWRDHSELFGWLGGLPEVLDGASMALLVPLLAVPQATHYILDAFIWKVRTPDPGFSGLLHSGGRVS